MLITEYAIERSKTEILEDMSSGKIPKSIASFAELVEYIDSHNSPLKGSDPACLRDPNEYGGLCESEYWWSINRDSEACLALCTGVQDAVNAWLKTDPYHTQQIHRNLWCLFGVNPPPQQ